MKPHPDSLQRFLFEQSYVRGEQRRIVTKVDQLKALVDKPKPQLTDYRASVGKLMEAVVTELSTQEAR